MALGSLIIKEKYQFSDEATVEHITMNPYLQYFIGLRQYTSAEMFNACRMTRFGQRITPEILSEVNDIVISRPKAEEKNTDDHQDGDGTGTGTGSAEQDFNGSRRRKERRDIDSGRDLCTTEHTVPNRHVAVE